MFKKQVYLQGTFELIISPAEKGDHDAARPLEQVLATPLATMPTYDFTSPYGDEISLPIPEGSIKAYVEKHQEKFNFPDAHIIIFAKYHRPPGEKTPVPEGIKAESVAPPKKEF